MFFVQFIFSFDYIEINLKTEYLLNDFYKTVLNHLKHPYLTSSNSKVLFAQL